MHKTIPNAPKSLPPSITAVKTNSPGNPTDFPTTWGYISCPSICWSTKNIIAKIRALKVETVAIRNMPIIKAINAPTIGIKEHKLMSIPIRNA